MSGVEFACITIAAASLPVFSMYDVTALFELPRYPALGSATPMDDRSDRGSPLRCGAGIVPDALGVVPHCDISGTLALAIRF